MTDIIDEVLNDTKHERKLVLFYKVFPVIIAATIVIAVLMTWYNWRESNIETMNRQMGDRLIEFVSADVSNDAVTASSLQELIDTSVNHQEELAELQLVKMLLDAGKLEEALTQLETIIDNNQYYEITTAFARLLWLNMILDKKILSDDWNKKAENYLNFFENPDQVFFTNATLIKALFFQKTGNNSKAQEYAQSLLKMSNASLILQEQAKAIIASATFLTKN